MRSGPNPKRQVTETALKLLIWTHADLQSTPAVRSSTPRILTLNLGTADPFVMRQEAAVVRMVSIVEAYLDALSFDLLNENIYSTSSMLDQILQDFEVSSTRDWGKRQDTFERYHQIPLQQCAGWAGLSAAKEARNAIAHRLGRLTPMQLRRSSLPTTLKTIDVAVIDNRIAIGSATLQKVRDVCSQFLRAVDEKLPQ